MTAISLLDSWFYGFWMSDGLDGSLPHVSIRTECDNSKTVSVTIVLTNVTIAVRTGPARSCNPDPMECGGLPPLSFRKIDVRREISQSIVLAVEQHHFRERLVGITGSRPQMISRVVIPSAPLQLIGKFFTIQIQTTQGAAMPQFNDQSVEQRLAGKTGRVIVQAGVENLRKNRPLNPPRALVLAGFGCLGRTLAGL